MGSFELVDSTLLCADDLYWDLEEEFDRYSGRLLQGKSRVLTIDLSRIRFIFSSFMSRFVRMAIEAEQSGKHMRFMVGPHTKGFFKLADMVGPLDVVEVEASGASARRSSNEISEK